jgi:protein-L-isoaspartate(D-aspartate) O-methyltransferase
MAQEAAQLDHLAIDRARMVERQIARRGVSDARVLDAMRQVPREAFVAPGFEEFAYEDSPLPIAEGQTISQPYIVALMIEAAEVKPGDWVLEVGTGSGYAAAVPSRIAAKVYTVERHGALAEAAKRRFARLGYRNIEVRHGDGTLGWPEVAPFDAIIVTAGGPEIPETLRNQLKVDGRLVIPIGVLADEQRLVKVVRDGEHAFHEEDLGAVRFVPLIGEQGWSERAPDESSGPIEVELRAPARPRPPTGLLREAGERLADLDDPAFGRLFDRFGDARVVLLGEATHGTSEFYRARAAITRRLIERHGFTLVAVEVDWPDAARSTATFVTRCRAGPQRRHSAASRPGCGAMSRFMISSIGCAHRLDAGRRPRRARALWLPHAVAERSGDLWSCRAQRRLCQMRTRRGRNAARSVREANGL